MSPAELGRERRQVEIRDLALLDGSELPVVGVPESRQARAAAERSRAEEQKTRRLSAALALDQGITLCEKGDPERGVHWLVRAMELAPEDSPLHHAARLNLAGWRP